MTSQRSRVLSALLLALAACGAPVLVACGAPVLVACGGPPRSDKPTAPPRAAPAPPAAALPLGPARYVLTDGMGVSFDEAGQASRLLRPEPAIASGERVVVEGGVIVASARAPEALHGFRSIPARLGGGFILWSAAHTYRAETFLGELRVLADVAAEGGVRPWLSTVVLRTELGLLELDPGTLAVKRTELARFSEVLSLDGKRGVRVDALGHAEYTSDGGAHWAEVMGDHGMPATVTQLSEGKPGTIELITLARPIVFGPGGALVPAPDEGYRGAPWEPQTPPEETQPASRQLASSDLASAVFAGALVPGGRALVGRAEGMRVFALASGQIMDDAPWAGVTEPFTRCQPASVGDDALLACTHPRGAHVLAMGSDPSAPRLEATFPDAGSGFVAGLGRRFGRVGRCGSEPPGAADFGPPEQDTAAPPAAPPDDESASAPPPLDRASFCVREGTGTWTPRRLESYDAVRLYRFLPGDAGEVVALVLEDARGKKQREQARPAPPPDGVRVLRIDPDDPALEGALFPAVPPPMEDAPYRAIDADYWLDASDGSVHGWVLLPLEGEEGERGEKGERELVPQGPSGRMLPVSTRPGGPVAGIRIAPDGALSVHPLPPGVVEVARGGRFALARADVDGAAVYHETTDGGRTWRPVLAPPVGELAASYGDNAIRGCSALGCVLDDGLVRLGWGGPPPPSTPPAPLELDPAPGPAFPRLSSLPLRCRLDAPAPGKKAREAGSSEEARPVAVSLRAQPGAVFGAIRGDTWTAEVFPPFDPSPSPRRVTAKIAPLSRIAGDLVPVLGDAPASPVELFLRVERFRFDLGKEPSRAPVPFAFGPRLTVAAALGPRQQIALDADSGNVVLIKGNVARNLMRAVRVANVTRSRLTLARGVAAGKGHASPAMALATVSAISGDILLGELDLERGQVGPLRLAGNLGALDAQPACRPDPRGFRLLADVTVDLRFEPAASELDGPYLPATALVSVGAGRACLEGLEVRLPAQGQSLAVRFSAPSGALVRGGESPPTRASCASP